MWDNILIMPRSNEFDPFQLPVSGYLAAYNFMSDMVPQVMALNEAYMRQRFNRPLDPDHEVQGIWLIVAPQFELDLPSLGANQIEIDSVNFSRVVDEENLTDTREGTILSHGFIRITVRLFKDGEPHVLEGDREGNWNFDWDNEVDGPDPSGNIYEIYTAIEMPPFVMQADAKTDNGWVTEEVLSKAHRYPITEEEVSAILSLVPTDTDLIDATV